jgi:uncharacterized membrane protein
MATVTVLKFASADGAKGALGRFKELHQQHLIEVHDAAIVSWPAGKKAPPLFKDSAAAPRGHLRTSIEETRRRTR